jgi:hypothetical protein
VDQAPPTIYATLLDDQQRYLCSVSTMYRLLRADGEVHERRRQATHPAVVKPELLAIQPNQVWSWDITKKLSQTGEVVIAAEPEQGTGELEQAEVIAGVFVPADQQGTALGQPPQGPLHDPAARRMALRSRWAVIADASDMGHVAVLQTRPPAGWVVIALIQT